MNNQSKVGVLCAFMAYGLWGIAPIYFKLLEQLSATDILLHRIVWSAFFMFAIVLVMAKLPVAKQVLSCPKNWAAILFSAVMLAINWLVFIWAINNDRMLDASLGYYINPILSVALAMLFLGERLRRLQKISVGFAVVGVAIEILYFGAIPWIALLLAASFGLYGLVKKRTNIEALTGLCIESVLMVPFALAYLVWFDSNSYDQFITATPLLFGLMIGLGVVTSVPLIFFNAAATRISLVNLGMIQYIGPSLMFLLAVVVYNETLTVHKLITFMFIWFALAVFSMDAIKHYRKVKLEGRNKASVVLEEVA